MSTKEEDNFLRIVYLNYQVATVALRNYFDRKHPNLASDLFSNKKILQDLFKPPPYKKRILYPAQWNILYPPQGSKAVSSADLDVTLMVCLLRNLPPTVLPPPKGFDVLPQSSDTSDGDHIARIKYYKNALVSHSTNCKLSDADFASTWNDLEMAIHGLGNHQDSIDATAAKSRILDYNSVKRLMYRHEILNQRLEDQATKISKLETVNIQQNRKRLNDQTKSAYILQKHSSKMAKLETTVENMETDRQSTKKDCNDFMIRKLQQWGKEDQEYFVETTAYNHVMCCLLNNKCVSVVGPPGVGKTFLVQHVALEMEKIGFYVISVRNPNEIKQKYMCNRKLLFVVDDMCGNFTANTTRLDLWKDGVKDLTYILDKDVCKLILTCRLQVFQDEGFNHSDLHLFKTCVCNLIDDKLALTNSEKEKLAKRYFMKTNIKELESLYKYECFPLLCKFYNINKDKLSFSLDRFLKEPFDIFQTELNNLFVDCKEGKYKFSALLLLVVCNNRLQKKVLEGKKLLKTILNECGIDERLTGKSLISQLDTLEGSYLVNENGVYHTIHDKLFDFLAYYFGTKNEVTENDFTEFLIVHADKDFVQQRFQIGKARRSDSETEKDYVILLSDDKVLVYIKRVFHEMTERQPIGIYLSDIRNRKSETFRKEMQTFINKLSNDEITQLIKKASIDFVCGMFVVNEDDIHSVCDKENCELVCTAHHRYSYIGIILGPDHFLEYIERTFVDMTNSDDVLNYILQCRNSRNDAFHSALLTLMTNLSSAQVKELIGKVSYSFVQVMFVITVEDVKKISPHVYMRYGIPLPSEVIQVYIERVFDDIYQSDKVNKHIKGNRNRTNVIFQTRLLDYMRQFGEQKIKHLIKTASQDFIDRLFVLTIDDVKHIYDFEYERYGVVIPEDCTNAYIARVFDGLTKSDHTENYLKHNRNIHTKAFKTSVSIYIDQLTEDEIEKLIQTASSDFLHKWFVTSKKDIKNGSIIEYEQYGIILHGKNFQIYCERILTFLKLHFNFLNDIKFNRNTRGVLRYITQLHISQIAELIQTTKVESFHKIKVYFQSELEEESSHCHSFDYFGRTILKLKEGIITWSDTLINKYMDRMVSDWSKGYLGAVLENINMKNKSFMHKFLDHLNCLEPFKISELINVIEHKEKGYSECMHALTVCCIYCNTNLAKWCLESHCSGNRNEKHHKMCALFMLVVFNNKLEEKTLLDEAPKVKDVMMSFGRNYDIHHVHEVISAILLREALDSTMHGMIIKRNGVYSVINGDVFEYLFVYFGSIQTVSNILIEYANVKSLYDIFIADSKYNKKCLIDLPDTDLQRCIERIFESVSTSNEYFEYILDTHPYFGVRAVSSTLDRNTTINAEAISTYYENLKTDKIEILIQNSCTDFFNNCFVLDTCKTKGDRDEQCKPVIVIPDGCINMYIQRLFDSMTKSDCVEASLNENRNNKTKRFHTEFSTFLKSIRRNYVEKLIVEASSEFISRMFVISEGDIKDERFFEHERYGIVIPENVLPKYIERVFNDIKKSVDVPINRNNENKTFRDTFHSYFSSFSEENISSLITAAGSKFISRMFLSPTGGLKDISSQRRESYFMFLSQNFYETFQTYMSGTICGIICPANGLIKVYCSSYDMPFFVCRQYMDVKNVLLTVSFKNDKTIDNLNQYPSIKVLELLNIDRTIKCCVRSSKQIVETYIQRIVQDWTDGKVHDTVGNINLRNPSFLSKFITYLENIDETEQTKLANTNDVDTRDSPLAVCCYVGILKLAEWCLENNSNTNSFNKYGEHPLYIACCNMHHDIVWCLLNHKNKANVNMTTMDGRNRTPLYEACERGHRTIVLHLLQAKVDVNYVRHLNDEDTPLCVACRYGHIDIVRLLLENKEDEIEINKGRRGRHLHRSNPVMPLYLACKGGHIEIVSLLLNHIADKADVNMHIDEGETPLYAACETGHKDIVSLLLEHETSGLNKSRTDGATSLFVASRKGHDGVVSILLKQKGIDIDKCIVSGMSPLFIASLLGHTKIVEMLLKRNANTNIFVQEKETVEQLVETMAKGMHSRRHWKYKMCDLETYIKYLRELDSELASNLLELHNDGMVEDRVSGLMFGSSPLHVGCAFGHTKIVELLVEKKADINCLNSNGRTPLWLANKEGHEDIEGILLSKGAEPILERTDGNSPISIAKEMDT